MFEDYEREDFPDYYFEEEIYLAELEFSE